MAFYFSSVDVKDNNVRFLCLIDYWTVVLEYGKVNLSNLSTNYLILKKTCYILNLISNISN